MRIAMSYAGKFPPLEGIGNYVRHLAAELDKGGHEVVLLLRGGAKYETEVHGNITVHRCPFFKVYPFHIHLHGLFAQRVLDRLEPTLDLVNLHTPISPPLKTKRPLVTTIHTPLLADMRLLEMKTVHDYLLRAQAISSVGIEKDLIARSAVVTTVSESIANELSEYGLGPDDVVVTPNGVNARFFEPAEAPPTELRFLYTGRLAPRKGLPDLLEAMARLKGLGHDFTLVITGRGPYLDYLQARAEKLDVLDRIDFAGFVSREELVALYRRTSVFTFPTYYEGLPTSVMEAMASGLPVASTYAPGVTDLIDHGENGLLCAPGDVDAFVENLESLIADPKMRERFGRENRKRAIERHDWSVVAGRMIDVYERLADD